MTRRFTFHALYEQDEKGLPPEVTSLFFDHTSSPGRPEDLDLLSWINFYIKKEVFDVETDLTMRAKFCDLHKFYVYFQKEHPREDLEAWKKPFTSQFIKAVQKEYSINTEYRIHATILNFANFLVLHGAIKTENNPVSGVLLRNQPEPPFEGIKIIYKNQNFRPAIDPKTRYKLLLEAAEALEEESRTAKGPGTARALPLRNKAILAVLHRAALRAEELCGLTMAQMKDVATTNGLAYIFSGVKCKGRRERAVHVRSDAAALLMDYINTERTAIAARLQEDDSNKMIGPFVFVSYTGKRLHQSDIYYILKKIEAKANDMLPDKGFPGVKLKVHPHALRHERGIMMKQQGKPDTFIQKVLGHKTLALISRYTTPSDEDMAEEIETLD